MKKLAPALVVVLVTASGALAAQLATSGTYKGTTSEGSPVTFKITDHGKVISNFATTLAYNGECGQGGGPDFNAKASRIAIGARGKFSQKVTLRLTTVAQAPGRISGTASGTHVHGTVVEYLHGKPNKCYTETFRASRS